MKPLGERLCKLVFGVQANTEEEKDIIPIYAYEGLKKNDRSSESGTRVEVIGGRQSSYNGSYSLASTVEQGVGFGSIKPVSQIAEDGFRTQLLEIIRILKRFYQLLLPISVSAFEWEITKFQLEDNNVFTAGGLDIGPVAIQMNVSDTWTETEGGDLGEEIGPNQGNIHPDDSDAMTLFTNLTVIFKLPKGNSKSKSNQ
jgi:hypothetical protein